MLYETGNEIQQQQQQQHDCSKKYFDEASSLTFLVEVCGWNEDEVARFHVFLALDGDGEGVEHVALVPRTQAEAKVLLQISHDAPHETATVEEERTGVFGF